MIDWHLEVIAHSYKSSPDKDPCPFGTLPKTLFLDGSLLLKYDYKLSKSRPLPQITLLPSLWDTTLWQWAFPVLMEFILMPKTQVVDHWCFLKEEINQKGEMWKENQSEVGIAKRVLILEPLMKCDLRMSQPGWNLTFCPDVKSSQTSARNSWQPVYSYRTLTLKQLMNP